MIKTELERKDTKQKPPVLMEFVNTPGLVVLFTSPTMGTVVSVEESEDWKVGDSDNDWIDYKDERIWKPFDGVVRLENS